MWQVLITIVLVGLIGLLLAVVWFAWTGLGRWLMAKAGVEDPPKKWWFWWRIFWVNGILMTILQGIGEANLEPNPGLPSVLHGFAIVMGACLGIGSMVVALVFAVREIGYQLRGRRRRDDPGSDVAHG